MEEGGEDSSGGGVEEVMLVAPSNVEVVDYLPAESTR